MLQLKDQVELTITLGAPDIFQFNQTGIGWTLVEDVPCQGTETLKLAEFLGPGESAVSGSVLLKRAREIGKPAGQSHAEALLRQQGSIPEGWRCFSLVCVGTLWSCSPNRYVPYLFWDGGCWEMNWGLNSNWITFDRLVIFEEAK